MVKPKLYLDTSVPSAYFDERAPDRQQLTRQFWAEQLSGYEGVISQFVLQEIDSTPDDARRDQMRKLVNPLAALDYPDEARKLVEEYLEHGVFKEKTLIDATHVAIAVAHRIGYLGSWNFKHLVNIRIRRSINLVNSLNGYDQIEIISPPEL